MNPKPLDAGLAERLYKSVKGPCAYPFKWLYPSEKAFWRVVAAEVRKIVKERESANHIEEKILKAEIKRLWKIVKEAKEGK